MAVRKEAVKQTNRKKCNDGARTTVSSSKRPHAHVKAAHHSLAIPGGEVRMAEFKLPARGKLD